MSLRKTDLIGKVERRQNTCNRNHVQSSSLQPPQHTPENPWATNHEFSGTRTSAETQPIRLRQFVLFEHLGYPDFLLVVKLLISQPALAQIFQLFVGHVG